MMDVCRAIDGRSLSTGISSASSTCYLIVHSPFTACAVRLLEIAVSFLLPILTNQSSGGSDGDDENSLTGGADAMGLGRGEEEEEEHVPFVLGSVSGSGFRFWLSHLNRSPVDGMRRSFFC